HAKTRALSSPRRCRMRRARPPCCRVWPWDQGPGCLLSFFCDDPVELSTFGRFRRRMNAGSDALGQPRRAQHAIGLDNPLEPLLGTAISAVGVGMKPLHEFLISRLYLVQVRV